MTFPSLPTDSLYKFLFIAGILLITVSVYLYGEHYIQSSDRLGNSSVKLLEIGRELDLLEIKTKSLKDSGKAASRNSIAINSDRIAATKIQMASLSNEVQSIERRNNIFSLLCSTAIIIGIVLMRKGYNLWYEKLQEPLDKITAIELKLKELELEERLKGKTYSAPNHKKYHRL